MRFKYFVTANSELQVQLLIFFARYLAEALPFVLQLFNLLYVVRYATGKNAFGLL